MPDAVERYAADRLGDATPTSRKRWAAMPSGWHPDELRPALERCIKGVASGQAALLEVMTHEESAFAGA
jgi:hypothetical protein